jgi:SecD/SecF fusion protein
MAIDANILIFERTKDELRNWKNIKEALEIWFKKSFSAIFDTHITWLLTALILFVFGINMIKWFWLMLWIWLIVSLFTVLYISKVFIIAASKSKVSQKNFIGKV